VNSDPGESLSSPSGPNSSSDPAPAEPPSTSKLGWMQVASYLFLALSLVPLVPVVYVLAKMYFREPGSLPTDFDDTLLDQFLMYLFAFGCLVLVGTFLRAFAKHRRRLESPGKTLEESHYSYETMQEMLSVEGLSGREAAKIVLPWLKRQFWDCGFVFTFVLLACVSFDDSPFSAAFALTVAIMYSRAVKS